MWLPLYSALIGVATVYEATAFSTNSFSHPHAFGTRRSVFVRPSFSRPRDQHVGSRTRLCMVLESDIQNSNDPFVILGLEPSPNLDKKAIKRAYKRLALRYHPDMTTTKDSTAEEKHKASELFAKINWAYATLSGKAGGGGGTSTSSSSTAGRSSTSSTSGKWEPPHRRNGAYASPSSSSSSSSRNYETVDWKDFIPNYNSKYAEDDQKYDSGGDSFGAIFSDLFATAAGAAAGSKGVFKDFVDFLENNIDGYSTGVGGSSSGNDSELEFILQAGSIQEVAEEMDDNELVVQQLLSKLRSVHDEVIMLQAEVAVVTRFTEKLQLEERIDELQARKKVVENYLAKARKRLLALQTRYKQLIVKGANDPTAGGKSRYSSSSSSSAWDPSPSRNNEPSAAAPHRTSTTSTASTSSTSSSTSTDKTTEDAWKSEGFGSFGRGRGSGRRRATRATTGGSSPSSPTDDSFTSRTQSPSTASSSSYGSSSSSSRSTNDATRASSSNPSQTTTTSTQSYEPPHRRSSSAQINEDRRRLRELQVEDEFEKLKRELGLK